MGSISKLAIFVAMVILTTVSMWTTYASLKDSILPAPVVAIPLTDSFTWNCSIFALGLSVAIGLMLFALKLAIVDQQKKLNFTGLLGMTIVAFISITFNMDVLYRVGDQDFFLRHSTAKVKSSYGAYLSEVRTKLLEEKRIAETSLARQEGELDAEVRGLREAPAGYGTRAKSEDHRLTVLSKEVAVETAAIDQALVDQAAADLLLSESRPETIEEIEVLQDTLRVEAKNVGALAGVALPEPISLENPLFAVFERLFDFENVGWKEIFFLILAFLIDLGDIIGYSLVPAATVAAVKSEDTFDVTRLPTKRRPRGPERVEEQMPFPRIEAPAPLEGQEDEPLPQKAITGDNDDTAEDDPGTGASGVSFKRRSGGKFRM